MVAESTLRRLEAEFDTPPDLIRAIVDLLEAGASPQFIAMFRRDESGDPGEERVVAIHERLRFLSELERRRESLLQLAEQRAQPAVLQAALPPAQRQVTQHDIRLVHTKVLEFEDQYVERIVQLVCL